MRVGKSALTLQKSSSKGGGGGGVGGKVGAFLIKTYAGRFCLKGVLISGTLKFG